MHNKPLVSVIIATFNRGWILSEAVDSVLSQDYAPFELIVIDDGSTDDTAAILNDYADSRLRVHFQPNRGVSAARNRGIPQSAGELIAFLDSDDLWLPGKISAQVLFFQEHPDALICQTEEIWIRNKVRVNPKNRHQKPSGDIFRPSLALCLVSPSAVMIRRSLLDEVGLFDETLPACEDYALWLRISCKHLVHLMDVPLILKRGGHEDQLSRAPSLDRFRIRAIEKLLQTG
jgi:glycosyltransferase involved in cell wall biosynthesis